MHNSRTFARSRLLAIGLAAGVATGSAAGANTLPPEVLALIDEQRKLIEAQNAKIDALEDRLDQITAAPAPAFAPQSGGGGASAATGGASISAGQAGQAEAGASAPEGQAAAASDGFFIEKGDFPGSIKIPGTRVSLGVRGFVKGDVIQAFDDIGPGAEELFNVTALPTRATDDASGDRNAIHARETRLAVIAQAPTETFGEVRGTIEGDFFGSGVPDSGELLTNSEDFRIRLAKLDVAGFTVGMDWTTYGDISAYPENLDFLPPGATPFIRQGLVRYTHDLGDGYSLAIAAENAEASVLETSGGALVDTTTSNDLPEFVLRGRVDDPMGHLQLASVLRSIRSDQLDESVFGWGVGLSGRFNVGKLDAPLLHPKDNVKFHVNYGDGVGRFITDNALGSFAAAVNPETGDFDTVDTFGVYGSAQHWWTDTVRSNVIVSYVNVDNPFEAAFASPSVTGIEAFELLDETLLFEGNIVWSPFPKVDVGAELQYGRREDEDGASGDTLRTQFSAKYSFP